MREKINWIKAIVKLRSTMLGICQHDLNNNTPDNIGLISILLPNPFPSYIELSRMNRDKSDIMLNARFHPKLYKFLQEFN